MPVCTRRYRSITLIWSPVIYLELCWELGCRELGKLDNYRTVKQQAEDKHTFVASDYYGDCTKSLLEVTIVLLTQSALLVFYVLGLYTGETPDFSNGRVFAFYYAGSRVCTLACTCTPAI